MSSNFRHLPTELLLAVFDHVDAKYMIECQKVCKSWFYPARIKLYFDIVICTNATLGKAIYSLQTNGHLVKNISLDSIESSPDYAPGPDFKTLLSYCSNVRSISSTGTTIDVEVLEALASLRSQCLSKLQKIPAAFDNCPQYTKCANKYRKSLTKVYIDHDRIDNSLISNAKRFPELVSLSIRNPVRDLSRFNRLLASCPKLVCISLVLQPFKSERHQLFLSFVNSNCSLQKLALTTTMNALFDFSHLHGLIWKFKALHTLLLVIRSDFLPRSTAHALTYWAEIIRRANRLQDVEIKAFPVFASRFPPNTDTINSRFVADCVETVIKSIHQQHQKRQPKNTRTYAITLIVCKEIKSHESYLFYKISSKIKAQELLVKIPFNVYRTDKIQELINEMGSFATSLCLNLPRNLPSAPTLDWILLTLLPACKTVQSLTMIGGIFKNKIQTNAQPQCVRELSLKNFGCTPAFLNSIAINFPCLERLYLTFDMKQTLNNKGISITMPQSRLSQIIIEPKNYGYALPRKSVFKVYLKTTEQSKPLRYRYDHVSEQNASKLAEDRPNTGRLNTVSAEVFKINVELGDLLSFLFVFDGMTRISWWK
ncbi:unnamed protein product [Mucor fragilis]